MIDRSMVPLGLDAERLEVLLDGREAPEAGDWAVAGQALRSPRTGARLANALRARVAAVLDLAQLAEVRDHVEVLLESALAIVDDVTEPRRDVADDDSPAGRPGSLWTLALARDELESLDFVLAAALRHARGLSPELRDAHDLTRAAAHGAAEQLDGAVRPELEVLLRSAREAGPAPQALRAVLEVGARPWWLEMVEPLLPPEGRLKVPLGFASREAHASTTLERRRARLEGGLVLDLAADESGEYLAMLSDDDGVLAPSPRPVLRWDGRDGPAEVELEPVGAHLFQAAPAGSLRSSTVVFVEQAGRIYGLEHVEDVDD